MNRRFPGSFLAEPTRPAREDHTLGSSTLYRLCAEVIALREKNDRQHKLFEQALTKVREALQSSFNSFAADTQRAYQRCARRPRARSGSAWRC